MKLSVDTETTGRDLRHGCRPFLVTTCSDAGEVTFWQWDVDPYTRQPAIPAEDVADISALITSADELILQNSKFDFEALARIGVTGWDWDKVQDTLTAGHLLSSNTPHDLTSMVLSYLDEDIEPLEKALKKEVEACRRYCRSHLPKWRIAKEGDKLLPSAKEKLGSCDYWLPRALAFKLNKEEGHPWYTVCEEYANTDSSYTLGLWKWMEAELKRRGLWEIYKFKQSFVPPVVRMEQASVSINRKRTAELKQQYEREAAQCSEVCAGLSNGRLEELPNGVSNALRLVLFEEFKLPVIARTENGNPSCDKDTIDEWLLTTPEDTPAYTFLYNYRAYKKRRTALGFIEAYETYQIPEDHEWARIYVSLNATATATLRGSMSNPNGQQISKQEIAEMSQGGKGHSARYMFGPRPGRIWYSLDFSNLEQVIPAYECGEELMIQLFEKPDDPPYFGSYHLLNASLTYPDEFWPIAEKKGLFKEKYKSTIYQWVKNGGFARLYGAGPRKVDLTFKKPGAYAAIEKGLPKMAALNQKYINLANKYGFVETLPDKDVNPHRGYPLLCTRTERGGIKPTVPLNYHVQGTAMWCTIKSMIRLDAYLRQLTEQDPRGYWTVLQVHDEVVVDFPRAAGDEPWKVDLPRVRMIKRIMEESGRGIGIPLSVNATCHPVSWSDGISL